MVTHMKNVVEKVSATGDFRQAHTYTMQTPSGKYGELSIQRQKLKSASTKFHLN